MCPLQTVIEIFGKPPCCTNQPYLFSQMRDDMLHKNSKHDRYNDNSNIIKGEHPINRPLTISVNEMLR